MVMEMFNIVTVSMSISGAVIAYSGFPGYTGSLCIIHLITAGESTIQISQKV